MATKTSGTIYLRKKVTQDGSSLVEDSLDLSSFINLAEGKCMRINQIWFQWSTDNYGTINGTDVSASGPDGASIAGQVTTASRATAGLASLSGNATVALNNLYAHVDSNQHIDFIAQDSGLNPVDFNDGYIVATDTLYFAVKGSTVDTWADDLIMSCILECETVKLSKDDAIALAVSQLA